MIKLFICFLFLFQQLACLPNKKIVQNYEQKIKTLEYEVRKKNRQIVELKRAKNTVPVSAKKTTICFQIEEESETSKETCYEILTYQ